MCLFILFYPVVSRPHNIQRLEQPLMAACGGVSKSVLVIGLTLLFGPPF